MVFSSITFIFYFLPLFLLTYFALPRYRNAILLVFSLVFYAWGEVAYVSLMVGSIASNYITGRLIGIATTTRWRRLFLLGGILGNLMILFFFKYMAFFLTSVERVFHVQVPFVDAARAIALPVGLSFFTFQGMSYVMDVYRGSVCPQRNPLTLATYISMFPQLVAGPIVRYETVARELEMRTITWAEFARGAHLFVWGLAAKVLLANTLAVPADAVFGVPPHELTLAASWFGTVCYTFQIYFDFAGYSSMAIGLGLMSGFHFADNFNRPYVSQSITEFWRRWHISLSTWFRDYLYIPLGGNRHGRLMCYRNLAIVFFLCGLWHGAKWTFIMWGLYHGCLLVLEKVGANVLDRIPRAIRHLYFFAAIMVGWVLFRSEWMGVAIEFLGVMAGYTHTSGLRPVASFVTPTVGLALTVCVSSLLVDWSALVFGKPPSSASERCDDAGHLAHGLVSAVLMCLVAMSLAGGTHNPFIYYRF